MLILDAGSEYLQDLCIVLFPIDHLPTRTMFFKFSKFSVIKGTNLGTFPFFMHWQLLLVRQGIDTEIFAVSDLVAVAETKEVSALTKIDAAYLTLSQNTQG